jgi:hypothetical protein
MGKDQAAQSDVNRIIAAGNMNPGIGTRQLKNLGHVSEARGDNGGRVRGEILGFLKDSYRPYYGLVQGPDFITTGIGKFQPITHVDIKNPVGTTILRNTSQSKTVYKQGVAIGGHSVYQRHLWSNPASRKKVKDYDVSSIKSAFPKTPENMLIAVDLDDMPKFEQGDVIKGIRKKEPHHFITLQK